MNTVMFHSVITCSQVSVVMKTLNVIQQDIDRGCCEISERGGDPASRILWVYFESVTFAIFEHVTGLKHPLRQIILNINSMPRCIFMVLVLLFCSNPSWAIVSLSCAFLCCLTPEYLHSQMNLQIVTVQAAGKQGQRYHCQSHHHRQYPIRCR